MPGAGRTAPTYAAYLEMEARSEERRALVAGDIFAMSGASIAHDRIVSRTTTEENLALPDRGVTIDPQAIYEDVV